MPSPSKRIGAAFPLLLLLAAACAGPAPSPSPPTGGSSEPAPLVYVAVGASESVGVGAASPIDEAWPVVFHRTAVPDAEFLNLGIPGATVADALELEVPDAVEERPDVVTVWLNANDLLDEVPPEIYEAQLTSLLGRLRATGATVLVANTPPLDHLPLFVRCYPNAPTVSGCDPNTPLSAEQLTARVASYNEAIGTACAATGAVVVDLHAVGLAARRDGREPALVAADGFHPSTEGHRLVAETFVTTYARLREAGA